MTDSEREEFVYDLANHYVTRTSKAGLTALAIDRMCDLLLAKPDEELEAMSPPELLMVAQETKDKRRKDKPVGF
jgi:predicted oxidoreductase|tara:strand:+ start:218 stop:439 length:222 start_codon:yes stop_codon:yes gene_type:complete